MLRLHRVAADGKVVLSLRGDAGVVANDVEASGPFDRFPDQVFDLSLVAYVASHEDGGFFAMLVIDLVFHAARSKVCDYHSGSGVCEADGGGFSDAGTGTSDYGYAALEAIVHGGVFRSCEMTVACVVDLEVDKEDVHISMICCSLYLLLCYGSTLAMLGLLIAPLMHVRLS